ncbi:MAG: hypothetical protein JWQ02_1569 [Capsulimonas sp.]|nr:hypothetical protein [Capsulimonas sp.]
MKEDKRKIRNQIIEAFKDTLYPGDTHLVQLDHTYYPDFDRVYRLIRGKSWPDLLKDLDSLKKGPSLNQYSHIFSCATPQACHYYLPALLITTMDLGRSGNVGGYLLMFLDDLSLDRGALRSDDKLMLELISSEQRQSIRSFLVYLIDKYPGAAETNTINYWIGN